MWNKSVRWTGNFRSPIRNRKSQAISVNHWFQKTVFTHLGGHPVEEIWIPELAKHLYLDAKDTSVFDSNTGCKRVARTLYGNSIQR